MALSGSLRRDLSAAVTQLPHHAPNSVCFTQQFDHQHPVEIQRGSLLKRIYSFGSIQVNNVHYQVVQWLAIRLTVEVSAPDKVIEAFGGQPHGAPLLPSKGTLTGPLTKMLKVRPIFSFWAIFGTNGFRCRIYGIGNNLWHLAS